MLTDEHVKEVQELIVELQNLEDEMMRISYKEPRFLMITERCYQIRIRLRKIADSY